MFQFYISINSLLLLLYIINIIVNLTFNFQIIKHGKTIKRIYARYQH